MAPWRTTRTCPAYIVSGHGTSPRRLHPPDERRIDRRAEIVVGGLPRRPLMRDRDAALNSAIPEATSTETAHIGANQSKHGPRRSARPNPGGGRRFHRLSATSRRRDAPDRSSVISLRRTDARGTGSHPDNLEASAASSSILTHTHAWPKKPPVVTPTTRTRPQIPDRGESPLGEERRP